MFKETSVHIRRSFVYQSPDGEEYTITYSETPDRKYVEIKRKDDIDGKNKVVHDFDLVCGIVDGIRESTRPKTKPRRNLRKPRVSDMRSVSSQIQSSVDQTMKQYDGDTPARVSLTMESPHEARTGVSLETEEVPYTPEPWSLTPEKGEHIPQWKKDAESRKSATKAPSQEKGTTGEGFHRLDANQLM